MKGNHDRIAVSILARVIAGLVTEERSLGVKTLSKP